jgi:hypothetical protein
MNTINKQLTRQNNDRQYLRTTAQNNLAHTVTQKMHMYQITKVKITNTKSCLLADGNTLYTKTSHHTFYQ